VIENSTDLTIIGAGAAGGALALFAARLGIKTIIIEKSAFPRYKPCGCGVTVRAANTLDLDLRLDKVETASFHDHDLSFYTSSPSPIFTSMRENLDKIICDEAVKKGAEFCDAENVISVQQNEHMVITTTDRRIVKSKWVSLATGCKSNLPRQLGFKSPKTIPAIEEELIADSVKATFRFDFGVVKGGYAWCFPKNGILSTGVLTTVKGINLSRSLEDYKIKLGLSNCKSARKNGHPIPSRPVKNHSIGRAFVIGDAAGLVDPLTFEGIYYSYKGAKLLANTLKSTYDNPDTSGRFYKKELYKQIIPEIKSAILLSKVTYSSEKLRHFLFSRYGNEMTKLVAEVFEGKRSYRSELFKPSNYLQMLLKRL
jgi:geranylgeranyl reductase family protein